jgi:hypothetical protein
LNRTGRFFREKKKRILLLMKSTRLFFSMTASLSEAVRLILVMTAIAFLAAPNAHAAPQATWAERYGVGSYGADAKPSDDPFYGSGFDFVVAIANMPDGGVVVAGQLDLPKLYAPTSNHTSGNSDATLVRYGPDGTVLWQRTLHQTNDKTVSGVHYPAPSHVHDMKTDAQGNIFICGGKGNPDNGGEHPFVAKFDASGNRLWENGIVNSNDRVTDSNPVTYNIVGVSGFVSLGLTTDGGVIAGASETINFAAGNTNSHTGAMIMKFGPDGSGQFHAVYQHPLQYNGVNAVCQAHDGSSYVIWLSHPTSKDTNGDGIPGSLAILVGSDGNVIKERGFTPSIRSETPTKVIATSDGGFLLFSQNNYPAQGGIIYGAGGFTLRKVTADLTPVFEKLIRPKGADALYGYSVTETPDGGFLIGTTSGAFGQNIGEGSYEPGIAKVSSTGELQFYSLVGGPKGDGGPNNYGPGEGVFAVQTLDGGYAFTCASASYASDNTGKPDWWTVKMDANRRVQNFSDNMRDVPLTFFLTLDDNQPAVPTTDHTRILDAPPPSGVTFATIGAGPTANVENTAQYGAPNSPALLYQAPPSLANVLPVPSFTYATTQPYRADKLFRFTAVEPVVPQMTMRVQYSNTPVTESSWVNLPGGGQMTLVESSKGLWELDLTGLPSSHLPNGDQDYAFRVIATAPGYDDSASRFSDKILIDNMVSDAAPTVSITSPANNSSALAGSDVAVTVSSTGSLLDYALFDNGELVARVNADGTGFASIAISKISAGKHHLSVLVRDRSGVEGLSDPVTVTINPNGGKTYSLVAGGGQWSNSASWQDSQGNPGVPGVLDLALIGAGTVTVSQDVTAGAVSLDGGTIAGAATLTITQRLTVSGGQISVAGLDIGQGAALEFVNDVTVAMSSAVNNFGTLTITGSGGVTGLGANTGASSGSGMKISAPNGFGSGFFSFIKNLGQIIFPKRTTKKAPGQGGGLAAAPALKVQGVLNSGKIISNDGGSIISNDGGSLQADSNTKAATAAFGYTQTAGETDLGSDSNLEQGRIVGPVVITGGSFTGSGIVVGSLTMNGGNLSPGHSAGVIKVMGDYVQGADATLIMEVASQSVFDQIQVSGKATLGGTLNMHALNPQQLNDPTTVTPLLFGGVQGNFTAVSSNATCTLGAGSADVALHPNAAAPSSGQPLNIATRMSVQAGDNVLIAGFIITGPSGSTKKVLIRGLGPSLAQFGVPNTISDPLLELHKSDGTVTNDDWQQGDTSQIPNGFAPGNPREAVIVATLAPGNYSAVVKGAHGETGVGIAEVYDLDSASPAKLGNIATRGFINTGDDVMIGGFIIGGNEPAKILVRAIGPTLSDFGVQGALQDPTLELHDSNGMSISNNDWRETQESEIIATTIPPSKDREPAILATLVPGNYTAVVRGKNNTTGVGLVEAYNLQ